MAKLFTVFMESEVYGREDFGPYDSEEEMFEAIKRLVSNVKDENDGIDRRVGIEISFGPVCQECDSGDGIESTPCGSFCADCFDEHCKECNVCKSENAKFPIF